MMLPVTSESPGEAPISRSEWYINYKGKPMAY